MKTDSGKSYKKIRLFSLIIILSVRFFPICSQGISDDVSIVSNFMKYWKYRYRFLGDDDISMLNPGFIQTGEGQGFSIPAESRNKCHDDTFWDFVQSAGGSCYIQNVYGTGKNGVLHWSDATVDLGNYIAVLATEWKLLYRDGYTSTDEVELELYYALLALNRLDLFGEFVYSSTPTINGFLARDDVPADFHQYFSDEYSLITSGESCTNYDTGPFPGSGCDIPVNPSYPFGNTMSQDQAIGILFGLRFVSELIPSTVIVNTVSLKQEAQNIANRIVTYIRDGASSCGYSQRTLIVDYEENLIPALGSLGAINFSLSLPPTWLIVDPVNCEPVCRGPFAHGFSWAIAETGHQITGQDYQNQYSLDTGAMVWNIFKSIAVNYTEQLRYNINMLLKLAVASNTFNVTDVFTAVNTGKEVYDLANAVINEVLPNTIKSDWDYILNTAPCNGICFDDYLCTETWSELQCTSCVISQNCHCLESSNTEWRFPYRWSGKKIQCSYDTWGEFPGLDYMLAYNLYRLAFADQMGEYPAYGSLIKRNIDSNYPVGTDITIGNDQYPLIIQAVSSLSSTSHLGADAHITFSAQKEIILEPGFETELGAEFETIFDFFCSPNFYWAGDGIVYFKQGNSYDTSSNRNYNNYITIDSIVSLPSKNTFERNSISTQKNISALIIIPNPSSGNFILFHNLGRNPTQLFITNPLGEVIFQSEIFNPKSEIDLSSHSSGLYFVKVITDDEVFVQKIVLQ